MAKKYKISESNLNGFWGLFASKKTPDKLQNIIDNDPVLKKLQSDLKDLNSSAKDYLDKVKSKNPERYKWLQQTGLVGKD